MLTLCGEASRGVVRFRINLKGVNTVTRYLRSVKSATALFGRGKEAVPLKGEIGTSEFLAVEEYKKSMAFTRSAEWTECDYLHHLREIEVKLGDASAHIKVRDFGHLQLERVRS